MVGDHNKVSDSGIYSALWHFTLLAGRHEEICSRYSHRLFLETRPVLENPKLKVQVAVAYISVSQVDDGKQQRKLNALKRRQIALYFGSRRWLATGHTEPVPLNHVQTGLLPHTNQRNTRVTNQTTQIDWVKILRPTRHHTGHFGHVLSCQSVDVLLKKLNPTQQSQTFPF